MTLRSRHVVAWLGLAASIAAAACSDEPAHNPPREQYFTWQKIEIPGAACGDGSQYKMFANFSNTSDNLVVVLEPGGACWDYDSCTGRNGIRGAANVNGLRDDHFLLAPSISPFLNRNSVDSPSTEWNMLYLPYCTGDVHTGNRVVTYHDESGAQPDVAFHHAGHADVAAAVAWINDNFTHVPKLLVTGCSAGGAGALVGYHFLRRGIRAVERGYLLDDSGPIFPSNGYSGPLHAKIREAWDLPSIGSDLPDGYTLDDMGTVNTALADEFPDDRLAITYFRRDFNYSLYSYERFYDFPPKAEILRMWDDDTQKLAALYGTRKNLYYFLPYWRAINNSHCSTLFDFRNSDIEDHDMTLRQWVGDLINDRPLSSMMEAPVPGEDP
jgi:hypothetical protein